MFQILRRFEWTWVGLLIDDDAYGHDAARIIQSELAQSGLECLAYFEVLPWDSDPNELQRIVTVMKTSTARVAIVFVYGIRVLNLMDEVWIYDTVQVCMLVQDFIIMKNLENLKLAMSDIDISYGIYTLCLILL